MRIFTIVLRYITFSMFMIHIGCNSIDQNNKHIVAETIEFKELNNSKEESFEYFNQRNLIEEFPFEANETYSFYREFIKFKNGLLNNIFYRNLPIWESIGPNNICLLYTSDAADERSSVDLGGRRIIKKKKNIK